jgi:hypothetical protein
MKGGEFIEQLSDYQLLLVYGVTYLCLHSSAVADRSIEAFSGNETNKECDL